LKTDPASREKCNEDSVASVGASSLQGKTLIISVHIPKTGGAAFADVLKIVANNILFMDYGTEPFSPTAIYRRGQFVHQPFESIRTEELLSGRSVIHGHFRIVKYLKQFPNASYITWLRDPVDRLASHYFFWKRSAHEHGFMNDPLCNKVITENMSLIEFAQLDLVRNRQHEFLKPAGPQYCDFVGITEEYDRSIKLLQKLFCPELKITPQFKNRNPDRPGGLYKLAPGIRERILDLNELDVKTYVEGLHRFRTLCTEVGV